MEFIIQASSPINTRNYCDADEKISEAIETIYSMMTEEALIIWNTIYIPLNYKYDISYMIDDILNLLQNLREASQGNQKINWSSNTFSSIWNIEWDENSINIDSKWHNVLGHVEGLLNDKNIIRIDKNSFVSEWKMLLKNIIRDLTKCGYNTENIYDMDKLVKVFNQIESYGILYK